MRKNYFAYIKFFDHSTELALRRLRPLTHTRINRHTGSHARLLLLRRLLLLEYARRCMQTENKTLNNWNNEMSMKFATLLLLFSPVPAVPKSCPVPDFPSQQPTRAFPPTVNKHLSTHWIASICSGTTFCSDLNGSIFAKHWPRFPSDKFLSN